MSVVSGPASAVVAVVEPPWAAVARKFAGGPEHIGTEVGFKKMVPKVVQKTGLIRFPYRCCTSQAQRRASILLPSQPSSALAIMCQDIVD
jgi:hypothetical protein